MVANEKTYRTVPVSGGLMTPLDGPEIVFGLVGAVGTDFELVKDVLAQELYRLGYNTVIDIRISHLMHTIDPKLPTSGPEDTRIHKHMDAGTNIRSKLRRGDALALLTVGKIRHERAAKTGSANKPINRGAFVIRSFKHPAEVATFRKIYGRAFFLIGAYTAREARRDKLARLIADSRRANQMAKFNADAEKLISRDEEETGKIYGQRLRDTFPLSDIFVRAITRASVECDIRRFLEIIFGYPFHTPSIDEHAMFHARAAAFRSADLSRQVGAVIVDDDGRILASGCNEVPKFRGGAYWPSNTHERRDFRNSEDPSSKAKQRLLAEVLHKLQEHGWLSQEKKESDIDRLVKEALYDSENPLLEGVQLMDLLEFGRVVHAEMSALMDAAQRGVSVDGARLFCTTFPCHVCARHIVSAGVKEVQYVEPYPKSLAKELHPDSMAFDVESATNRAVFKPFSGITPSRYGELFEKVIRKTRDGEIAKWQPHKSAPRFERFVLSYLLIETIASKEFDELLKNSELHKINGGPENAG